MALDEQVKDLSLNDKAPQQQQQKQKKGKKPHVAGGEATLPLEVGLRFYCDR